MDKFFEILQQQGLLGLFIFGAGFSVIALLLVIFFLVKSKVISFNRKSEKPANGKTTAIQAIKDDEKLKEFIRAQMAETRKVVYEMKSEADVSQARTELTLQHLETGISKMVDVMVDLKTEISKSLNGRSKG